MLKEVNWTYICVDEGHRLKNKDCRLSVELKKIKSKNRLLLTGTPLQNDLEELCALLSYLQPDLFTHHELFSVRIVYTKTNFNRLNQYYNFANRIITTLGNCTRWEKTAPARSSTKSRRIAFCLKFTESSGPSSFDGKRWKWIIPSFPRKRLWSTAQWLYYSASNTRHSSEP